MSAQNSYHRRFKRLVVQVKETLGLKKDDALPRREGWGMRAVPPFGGEIPSDVLAELAELGGAPEVGQASWLTLCAQYFHELWLGESRTDLRSKVNTVEIATTLFSDLSTTPSLVGIEGSMRRSMLEESAGLSASKLATKVVNLFNAMRFLSGEDFSMTQTKPISEELIKQVHAIVGKDLIHDSGEYRRGHVGPGGEAGVYLPPRFLAKRMPQLVAALLEEWGLCEDLAGKVAVATVFFSEFLLAHPFNNGNGRVARLLLNYLLHRDVAVPFTLCGHYAQTLALGKVSDSDDENERKLYLDVLEVRSNNKNAPPSMLAMYMLTSIRRAWTNAMCLATD